MRYDSEHKRRTRERVLEQAALAIRRRGPDGVGIASLMAHAGLTHGGFYAHFTSKDDLVAEAVSRMFDDRIEAIRRELEGVAPEEGLARFIDRYLSVRHRDRRERGCPAATLAGDVARMPARARKPFDAGVRRMIALLADVLRTIGRPDPELLAASVVSEMVGGLALARGMTSAARSERFLAALRKSVKTRMGIA